MKPNWSMVTAWDMVEAIPSCPAGKKGTLFSSFWKFPMTGKFALAASFRSTRTVTSLSVMNVLVVELSAALNPTGVAFSNTGWA